MALNVYNLLMCMPICISQLLCSEYHWIDAVKGDLHESS